MSNFYKVSHYLNSTMAWAFNWCSTLRFALLILLVVGVVFVFFTLPIEKILNDFLIWVHEDLGSWGPFVLAIAYIPLTILAVPAAVLTLGGGYLFGLTVGILADSIGATVGAGAAFVVGRTIGKSFVDSKLNDYPQFRLVEVAIQKSGFKIVLLLRLVPMLPFSMLNYLLSVTSVSIGEYMLASWLGMLPITVVLVYAGTTLKDLSDVTNGSSELSATRWVMIAFSLIVSVILMIYVTKVAKTALDDALTVNEDVDSMEDSSPHSTTTQDTTPDGCKEPLIVKINESEDEKKT